MTVHPRSRPYSETGGVRPFVSQPCRGEKQWLPSVRFQPKLRPPVPARATSTSSHELCPTSPIHRSPFARSNDIRHGLRRPVTQISGDPPPLANGLPSGMPYSRPSERWSTSIRRIFPSRVDVFWPLPWGSPPDPPSPSDRYRSPSGPKSVPPPLWFEYGWSMKSSWRCDASTCSALLPSRTRLAITVSPLVSV